MSSKDNAEIKSGRNFLVQGSILAVAAIVAKVIGLLYRMPLTNIIGDSGNSYYSTANEIYSIILMISSFSLPLAISRMSRNGSTAGNTATPTKCLSAPCGLPWCRAA